MRKIMVITILAAFLFSSVVFCLERGNNRARKNLEKIDKEFERLEYYRNNRHELDENKFEDVCLLAQFYIMDAYDKEQNQEQGYKGDYLKALAYYKKAIKLNDRSPIGYRGASAVYYHDGLFEKAIDNGTKAFERGHKDFGTAFVVADSYYQLRKFKEAMLWLKKIQGMTIDNPEIKKAPEYPRIQEMIETIEAP